VTEDRATENSWAEAFERTRRRKSISQAQQNKKDVRSGGENPQTIPSRESRLRRLLPDALRAWRLSAT